jgi:hypothetical protein
MQFQVPQFLDVEDKIIGPFTIKQFLYLAGGAGFAYLSWRYIPYLGWPIGGGMLALGASLAFYKFNSKPFIYTIEDAINYIRANRLYVWRRREKEAEKALDLNNFKPVKHASGLLGGRADSKLNDLTWGIDVTKDNEVEVKKVHSENAL